MKKTVNVRLPVILAFACAVGVTLGCIFVYFNIALVWIAAVVPLTAVILIICALADKNIARIIIIILTALFVILGAVNCFLRLNSYTDSPFIADGNYAITASVYEKGETEHGKYLILSNVKVNGKYCGGKIIAYLADTYGDYCDVGYKVSFTANISQKDAFNDGKLSFYAQENIKYSCYVNGGLSAKYGFSLFGSIRSAIRKTLYANLDKDTAGIAYAMLTGNTQGIEDGIISAMRNGGIAHIFAVSGLHIGIVFGIINFICKKLRLNKYVGGTVCLFFILFYTGICGFTLSSVRAVVMCAVAIIARLAYKKCDGLNSLSLSTAIILLITPLSLFAVGFQLSVCSVGSIILLSKNIAHPFKRLPNKLKNTIGVSLSAQAGTLPVMLSNFGYVSGAGLLMNIFVLPILSFLFVILFISTFLSVIFAFAAPFILPYAALPLEFMISLILNAGFENALISGFGSGLFSVIYFIGLFALSDKINIKPLKRVAAVICTTSALCLYILFFN